eukprot:GHVS01095629.1.p1 GENE.GHVS01095629.1~~GHVS01095629.1.p1  ORF type:complete len:631 (+),score=76.58 GHVS01095629.1:99-1895(+)
MTAGSVRGSIFSLASTALGAGVLTTPYAMSQTGAILGVLLLIIDAVVCFLTTFILSDSVHLFKCRTYACLAEKLVGKWLGLAVDGLVSFNGFAVSATLMVFLGDFAPPVTRLLWRCCSSSHPPWWLTNRMVVLSVSLVTVWPLAIQKNISGLRNFSVLPVLALSFTGVMVIIDAPRLYHSHSGEAVVYATLNWNTFKSFNIFLFAFMQHVNVCLIADEIYNPTNIRILKILTRSVLLEFVLYFCISLFGYVSWMSHTKQNFVNNYSEGDKLFSVCRVALMLSMLVAIPVNNIAAGRSMVAVYKRWKRRWRRDGAERRRPQGAGSAPPGVATPLFYQPPVLDHAADDEHSQFSSSCPSPPAYVPKPIAAAAIKWPSRTTMPTTMGEEACPHHHQHHDSSVHTYAEPAGGRPVSDRCSDLLCSHSDSSVDKYLRSISEEKRSNSTTAVGERAGFTRAEVGRWRRGRGAEYNGPDDEEGGEYIICSGEREPPEEEEIPIEADEEEEDNRPRLIAVTSCLLVSYCVALLTDRVADIIGLMGGIISTCLMCLFPSLIYYRGVGQLHSNKSRWSVFLFLQVVSLIGIVSSVVIILQALNICCHG